MATTDRRGCRKPAEGTLNHFEKLLKGPCPNHAFPVKHLLKDCSLMRRFLSGGSNKGEHGKDPAPTTDAAEEKDDGFPTLDGCLVIFRGLAAYDSKHRYKVARREVYKAELATPPFLRWPESTITFDWTDHPDSVPHLRRYPPVVDPIVDLKRLTKVLMDGCSGLNIMYAKMLDEMGIDQTCLHPT